MTAILSGGQFSGKEIQIHNAYAAIWVTAAEFSGFAILDSEVRREAYELTSISGDTAIYNVSEFKEVPLDKLAYASVKP